MLRKYWSEKQVTPKQVRCANGALQKSPIRLLILSETKSSDLQQWSSVVFFEFPTLISTVDSNSWDDLIKLIFPRRHSPIWGDVIDWIFIWARNHFVFYWSCARFVDEPRTDWNDIEIDQSKCDSRWKTVDVLFRSVCEWSSENRSNLIGKRRIKDLKCSTYENEQRKTIEHWMNCSCRLIDSLLKGNIVHRVHRQSSSVEEKKLVEIELKQKKNNFQWDKPIFEEETFSFCFSFVRDRWSYRVMKYVDADVPVPWWTIIDQNDLCLNY